MQFLLPDAERWRRVLATGALLAVLTLLAVWPQPVLERAAGALVAPLTSLLARGAGPLADAVHGVHAPAPDGTAAGSGLAAWERRHGRPPEAAGVAWLEVPVQEHRRAEGRLLLAAGREYGLAPEQAVAFGGTWIGRVEKAGDGAAVVKLWTAADARTGVWLRSAAGESLRAVTLGVKSGATPLVAWLDAAAEPSAGMEVLWRPRAGDPPSLDGVLALGTLEPSPQPLRSDPVWQVQGALPPGAEGRVYVAAQAVGPMLVAEPPLWSAPATLLLGVDAVLGPASVAVRRSGRDPAAVVLADERVLGRVGACRGALLWVVRRRPEAWGAEALDLDDPPGRYTRGDGRVPRGLLLDGVPQPGCGAPLQAVARRAGSLLQP